MTKKTAFVIMPIKKENTEEHDHFFTIYSNYVKPILTELEYNTIRTDEDINPGPIDKKLINYLTTADLVIADLSTLNPNVFYELGIRHALKSKGTILIVDDSITPNIPFDVHNYTIIHFSQELKGIGKLIEKLKKAIKDLQLNKTNADNPIYDWVGEHKTESNTVDKTLDQYTEFRDILERAKFEAENNLTPRKILEEAQMAILETADNQPDLSKFVLALKKFIELKIFVRQPEEFIWFYELIEKTDLKGKLSKEILDLAVAEYPSNSKILRSLIAHLAHSEKAEDRDQAKQKIKDKLKIEVNNRTVTGIDSLVNLGDNVHLISLMLDAYHRDGQNSDALKIAENLLKQFPTSTVAARNYARALSNSGNCTEADVIAAYTEAINCIDVDDVTARWFASYLWRRNKYQQAIEMIIFACRLDYSEADSFATLAAFVSEIMVPRNDIKLIKSGFTKPDWFNRELIVDSIWISKTCENFGTEQRAMCNNAQKNAGITGDELTARYFYATRENAIEFILPLYEKVKSALTNKITDVSTR
jgi:tetratricopeptide (TPR) repeat protein